MRRGKQCEAYFYVGQYLLIQGKRSEAVAMFQRDVATGLTGFIEYNAAKAELARLGENIRRQGDEKESTVFSLRDCVEKASARGFADL